MSVVMDRACVTVYPLPHSCLLHQQCQWWVLMQAIIGLGLTSSVGHVQRMEWLPTRFVFVNAGCPVWYDDAIGLSHVCCVHVVVLFTDFNPIAAWVGWPIARLCACVCAVFACVHNVKYSKYKTKHLPFNSMSMHVFDLSLSPLPQQQASKRGEALQVGSCQKLGACEEEGFSFEHPWDSLSHTSIFLESQRRLQLQGGNTIQTIRTMFPPTLSLQQT